jgi:hypothetical protein
MRTARQISALRKALKAKADGTYHHVIPKGTNSEGLVIKPAFVNNADIAISVKRTKETAKTPKTIKVVKAKFIPTPMSDELTKEQSIDRTSIVRTKTPKITILDADGFYVDARKSYMIINPNGYTREQLSTELPKVDIDYINQDIKIPLNYGMGVEVLHKGEHYIFQRNGNCGKAVVTLDITTWQGISCGAMHYYGNLEIKLPEMTQVNTKSSLSSNFFIPMYNNYTIELTQELEQWEIDKYPENYRYNDAGDRHKGFYTKKHVIEYAKLVFDQIFEDGWIFRIDN